VSMFCYQCEQTAKGTGCTVSGVCGKSAETAVLQDLLVDALKGIGTYAHRARQLGRQDNTMDRFVLEALFATLTNVNFDPARFEAYLAEAAQLRQRARTLYEQACQAAGRPTETPKNPSVMVQPGQTRAELLRQGEAVGIAKRLLGQGPDVTGLEELIMYGLKGLAAYAEHAAVLGCEDDDVYAFAHDTLNFLAEGGHGIAELLGRALKVGEVNLKVMSLLDEANSGTFGQPEPTQVRITPVKGKAILMSGHDLRDLDALLQQTEGKGVNVYTHGEMLPAHAYPRLKKYPHLVANYGGAWQDQRREFDAFPGAIVMNTNCLQQPNKSYQDRIFTCNVVGFPGVRHLVNRDFAPAIAAALQAPGFPQDAPAKTITVGFMHHAVLGLAGKVIEAVRAGKIRRFFLIGGCDGAKPGRNYYTEFAEKVPKNCIILTLACGKYRFNQLDFGDIEGIPRLLDVGQCNDAYSAIQIALALAQAFNCGVNDLPLSLVLSWFEQKAVVILLTLLHLGIRGIRLGPSLPAFVTPAALKVLAEKFDLKPISTPPEDLAAILGD